MAKDMLFNLANVTIWRNICTVLSYRGPTGFRYFQWLKILDHHSNGNQLKPDSACHSTINNMGM